MTPQPPPGETEVGPVPDEPDTFVEVSTYPGETYVQDVPKEGDNDQVYKQVTPEVSGVYICTSVFLVEKSTKICLCFCGAIRC